MRGVDFKIGCGFDTWVRHQHQIYRKYLPSSGSRNVYENQKKVDWVV